MIIPIVIIGISVGTLAILFQGESMPKTILVDSFDSEKFESSELVLMETNGIKHLIPLDKIKSGGPPKDGIPSIDDPIFANVSESFFYV